MPFSEFRQHHQGARSAGLRLARDRRGATAVEFGLVSLPFLALLGALFQTTLIVWAQQSLDFALQRTVRALLTGQFQMSNSGTSDPTTLLNALKTSMCASATVFTCSNVKLDVSLGSTFAASMPTSPVDPATKNWAPGFGSHYTCAPPGSIVVATAAVSFPVFFGLWNAGLSNFADGSKLLQSTAVFRTEPYGTSTC